MPKNEEKQFPQLLGVHHDPNTMKYIRALIDRLPKNSKVGLEFDAKQMRKHDPEFPLPQNPNEEEHPFSHLAEYAESKGHTVVWLERPSSWFPAKAKEEYRKLLHLEKQFKEKPSNLTVQRTLARQQKRFHDLRVALSPWRSTIMTKVLKKTEWKRSDLAIVGGLHAQNLEKALKVKAEHIHAGHKADYALMLQEGKLEEETESAALHARRIAARKMKNSSIARIFPKSKKGMQGKRIRE